MRRPNPIVLALLTLAAVAAVAAPGAAQGVQWRQDYAAARREAGDTGRPLLLDIGTEDCFWCQRLDATTFRDPTVVAALNERFIPVRVNGDEAAGLVTALGVRSYPT